MKAPNPTNIEKKLRILRGRRDYLVGKAATRPPEKRGYYLAEVAAVEAALDCLAYVAQLPAWERVVEDVHARPATEGTTP